MAFQTLATLVKSSLIDIQLPANAEDKINRLLERSATLQKAGFDGQASEVKSQSNEISNSASVTNQLKHWRDKGYLTIRIKNMNGWRWRHGINNGLWTFPLPTRVMTKSRHLMFFSKMCEKIETNKVLALVNATEYLAPVPDQILEKATEFRHQVAQDYPRFGDRWYYPGIQMFVLTVADKNNLKNIVRERPADPLLLYRIHENDNHLHLRGNFVVVGWWGADIEEIERELELDRALFPSTIVRGLEPKVKPDE